MQHTKRYAASAVMNILKFIKKKAVLVLLLIFATVFCFVWKPDAAYATPADGATVQYSGTLGTCTWEIYTDGTMVIRPTNGDEGTLTSMTSTDDVPWYYNYGDRNAIRKVEFQGTVHAGSGVSCMFYNCQYLKSVDFTGFDTSLTVNMSRMFELCKYLESLNLSSLDTTNVTRMDYMFKDCRNISSLDVSGFDTGNVTDMQHMFEACNNLTDLDVSGFDTKNVTTMASMFWGCNKLQSLDVSNFDTSNVTNMERMFCSCGNLTSLDVSSFDTGNVTNMVKMFDSCRSLTSLDLSRFDTSNVTNMQFLLSNCRNLANLNLNGFDTSNVQNMQKMFYMCNNLTSLDISSFNTSNVTDMSSMFAGCNNITSLDVSSFDTSNVTNMNSMFYNCYNITDLNVSSFDTSNVTDMGLMFRECNSLTSLDVSNFDTSNVTAMQGMFQGCSSFTSLDVSGFDTSKATSMAGMFESCSGLTSLDVSNFDTSNVIGLSNMFCNCSGLTYLDLSNFNTDNVTIMTNMFSGCSSLESLNISNFNTGNVELLFLRRFFSECSKLKKIEIGETFRFKGKNITVTDYQALFPTPSCTGYTGKWIHEDETVGPFTAEEIRDNYDANAALWAGKWIWEINDDSAEIYFDPNGGVSSAPSVVAQETPADITFPEENKVFQKNYALTGWSTSQDGSGVLYAPGSSVAVPVTMGKITRFYAQWRLDTRVPYTVKHFQMNLNLETYSLTETEAMKSETYYDDTTVPFAEVVTPEVKQYEGFTAPEPQSVSIAADGSTVIEYYYERNQYTITFDGNGADEGAIADINTAYGIPNVLPVTGFSKNSAILQSWCTTPDGTGTRYALGQTVMLPLNNGETLTLYAQWFDSGLAENSGSENGEILVYAKAGEQVIIPGLPAGTTYTIEEVDIPNGWNIASENGPSGNIAPNTVTSETFENAYSARGTAAIVAHKTLREGTLNSGMFTFELRDSENNIIDIATNGNVDTEQWLYNENGEESSNPWIGTAPVHFADLEIPAAGIYTYTITEQATDPENYVYDTHEETVTVTAVDAGGGALATTVEYDGDGALFENEAVHKPGNVLSVKKTGVNATEESANQEFRFTLDVSDADGNQLNGPFQMYVEHPLKTTTVYSHTDNVDDQGVQHGDVQSSVDKVDIVTIPGVSSIHVTVTYSNVRGYFRIWAGAHEEVYQNISNAEFNNSTALKSYSYVNGKDHELLYDEFDVPGDSITIKHNTYAYPPSSSSYSATTDYGYYITVSSTTKTDETPTEIGSGDEFTLKTGECVYIDGIPQNAVYKITEADAAGWELARSENANGTMQSADIQTEFRNVYSTYGSAQIQATKDFGNHEIYPDTFRFELQDAEGNAIQQVYAEPDGSITFAPLDYENMDDGKTYTYYVVEIPDENTDIIYDESRKEINVTVHDNGDGTMTTDISYDPAGMTFVNDVKVRLLIDLHVTGNLANREKYFPITLVFTNQDGSPCTEGITLETECSSWKETTPGTYTFSEKHGDSVTMIIPNGVNYHVEENPYNYTSTVRVNDGETTIRPTTPARDDDDTAEPESGLWEIHFVNTLQAPIPTDPIHIPWGGMIAGLLAMLGVAGYFYYRRKRPDAATSKKI